MQQIGRGKQRCLPPLNMTASKRFEGACAVACCSSRSTALRWLIAFAELCQLMPGISCVVLQDLPQLSKQGHQMDDIVEFLRDMDSRTRIFKGHQVLEFLSRSVPFNSLHQLQHSLSHAPTILLDANLPGHQSCPRPGDVWHNEGLFLA